MAKGTSACLISDRIHDGIYFLQIKIVNQLTIFAIGAILPLVHEYAVGRIERGDTGDVALE